MINSGLCMFLEKTCKTNKCKIIYIADYIEPGRDQAPRLEYIRQLAFQDLNQCMAEILYDTLHYLSGRKGSIDPATRITYDFYMQYRTQA